MTNCGKSNKITQGDYHGEKYLSDFYHPKSKERTVQVLGDMNLVTINLDKVH